MPSKNFFHQMIEKIAGDEFQVRTASPLESGRWDLRTSDVEAYFNLLHDVKIEEVDPSLIINIDEIGFGQSKSGRGKPVKVLCSTSHVGPVTYRDAPDTHYITAIAAITASGYALNPGLIIRRQNTHPDMLKLPFWKRSRVYSSPKAFISRNIFEEFVKNNVCNYINKRRQVLQDLTKRAVILMDGHKSHVSAPLTAYLAEANIQLIFIPPHSSHVLQPCDQGYFRRLKQIYNGSSPIRGYAKIAAMLQRVSSAFQGANVDFTIISSWGKTGIEGVVESGDVTRVRLNRDVVLNGGELHLEQPSERLCGERITAGKWGLLNQREMMLAHAGLCPFCGSVPRHRTASSVQENRDLVAAQEPQQESQS